MTEQKVFAELGSRATALFLDLLAAFAAVVLLAPFVGDALGHAGPFVLLLLLAVYFIGFTASPLQGTPGKRLMGIKVTDLSGKRIGLGRSVLRFAVSVASLGLAGSGLVVAAWTKRRQSLHDLGARTLVVRVSATPAEVALAAPAPYGWVTRIGFPATVFFIAFAMYVATTFERAFVRREAMLELVTEMNAYRDQVEWAMAERRAFPGPAKVQSRHGRELRTRPDGTIVLEADGFFAGGRLVYAPATDASGKIAWRCSADGIEERYLFPLCRKSAP